jgi:3-phosphoglycerate kinase
MKTLKEFDFQNKRVLVRCDFNVPLDEKGNILDDFKIKKTIPTIEYLRSKNAKIILMSHLAEPKGVVVESMRLYPVQKRLSEILGIFIKKADDCIGEQVKEIVSDISNGEILLLENLRFHQEEKENNQDFAKELASLGDIYINDAFAVSHREHASLVSVPKYLPSGIGFLFEKEIDVLKGLVEDPKRPLIVIIGGTKVETKAKLIEKFSEVADWILVSGLIQKEINEKGLKFTNQKKIISPVGDLAALDINEESVKMFQEKIKFSKTIFWNGPFGKIEQKEYAIGSRAIADAIINSGAFSVVGGGETIEFINKLNLGDKFNYVSSGGGAMLDFLADGTLPGIIALKKSEPRPIESGEKL